MQQPAFRIPPPLWRLTLVSAIASLLLHNAPPGIADFVFSSLAFIPARTTSLGFFVGNPVGSLISPVGYALLHVGFLHFFLNHIAWIAFGSQLLRRTRPGQFWFIALSSTLSGALGFWMTDPLSRIPMIGASGMVSGIMAALALLSPRAGNPFIAMTLLWLMVNGAIALMHMHNVMLFGRLNIAWQAHIGGMVGGGVAVAAMMVAQRRWR